MLDGWLGYVVLLFCFRLKVQQNSDITLLLLLRLLLNHSQRCRCRGGRAGVISIIFFSPWDFSSCCSWDLNRKMCSTPPSYNDDGNPFLLLWLTWKHALAARLALISSSIHRPLLSTTGREMRFFCFRSPSARDPYVLSNFNPKKRKRFQQ